MHKKIKKDTRNKVWKRLEKEIASRGNKKDKTFVLKGKWKKFLRNQEGYKIFLVDGKWIRNNISVLFSHGGHSYVCEFIPPNEIWIDSHHYCEGPSSITKCECKVKNKNQKISKNFLDSTVIHEITEVNLMKKGKSYYISHEHALEKEREIGLLKDPYDDT
jgi:hypothetical protein